MVINDDTRIHATLTTLDFLVEKGAKILLAAHLGRPKGQREDTLSLRPVAQRLSDLLGRPVALSMIVLERLLTKRLPPSSQEIFYSWRMSAFMLRRRRMIPLLPLSWRPTLMCMSTTRLELPIGLMPPPKESREWFPKKEAPAPRACSWSVSYNFWARN